MRNKMVRVKAFDSLVFVHELILSKATTSPQHLDTLTSWLWKFSTIWIPQHPTRDLPSMGCRELVERKLWGCWWVATYQDGILVPKWIPNSCSILLVIPSLILYIFIILSAMNPIMPYCWQRCLGGSVTAAINPIHSPVILARQDWSPSSSPYHIDPTIRLLYNSLVYHHARVITKEKSLCCWRWISALLRGNTMSIGTIAATSCEKLHHQEIMSSLGNITFIRHFYDKTYEQPSSDDDDSPTDDATDASQSHAIIWFPTFHLLPCLSYQW